MTKLGLLKKENCSICGQPKGLLGTKLGDGNCVCSKCWNTGAEYPFHRVELYERRVPREMTLDDFKRDQAFLQERRRKLKEFDPTITYKGIVHIDEDSKELVFTSDLEAEKSNEKPNSGVVHNLDDLVYATILSVKKDVKEGLLNDHMVLDVFLLAAFNEPLTKFYAVTLEKNARRRISGVFKKTYAADEECDKLSDYLSRFSVIAFAPDSPVEAAYWEGVCCAEDHGYLEFSDVADLLKLIYRDDKAKIKAIRKQYKL